MQSLALVGPRREFVTSNNNSWPGTGSTWTGWSVAGSDSNLVNSNRGYSANGTGGRTRMLLIASANQAPSADYETRAGFYYDTTNTTAGLTVYVRADQSAFTGYIATIAYDGAWLIGRYNGGNYTPLLTGNITAPTQGVAHDVGLKARNNGNDVDLELTYDGGSLGVIKDTSVDKILTQGLPCVEARGVARAGFTYVEIHTVETGGLTWGVVDDQTELIGATPSLDLNNYVTGVTPPATFSYTPGSEELSGTVLNSDGTFTGALTAVELKNLQFDVVDATAQPPISSNIIEFNVSDSVPQEPQFIGSIADQLAQEGVPKASVPTASNWSSVDTLAYTATGSIWPSGVTVNATTGAIEFDETSLSAGTYPGLSITATDTYDQATPSNTFTITVAAAGVSGTISTSEPLDNGAGTPVSNTAVTGTFVVAPNGVGNMTGATFEDVSGTTGVNGTFTTTVGVPSTTQGELWLTDGLGNYWIETVTVA